MNIMHFTDSEMNILWKNKQDIDVAIILLLCYTGWIAQELINIKRDDVDPDDLYMKGGIFTERTVPIHWALHNEIFLRLYWYAGAKQSEYYLCDLGTAQPLNYSDLERRFRNKMAVFHMKHKLQDTRLQFIHMCKEAKMDEHMISYLTGTGSYDYNFSELKSEIDRLEYKGGLMPVYMW